MADSDSVRRELPYTTVVEDELRIPLSDLARYILREVGPGQLLDAVLKDDTARDMWLEAVGRCYMEEMLFSPPPSATAVLVERQPVHVRRPGERTFPEFFSHDVAATPPMAAQVIEQRRRNGYCVCSDSRDAGDGICATCRMHLGAVS